MVAVELCLGDGMVCGTSIHLKVLSVFWNVQEWHLFIHMRVWRVSVGICICKCVSGMFTCMRMLGVSVCECCVVCLHVCR